ncbi:SWIM zinc finger family protein [Ferviditalea candida]|uniref:SWIM zinc finger family protein n=1 Tax=Ferviditalea candida TaxID=3108399 RepID=A0ABU5ZGD1_9BACL|nr:SWIM zinc finger family protein [Paenibacillaceae bacterium T2]
MSTLNIRPDSLAFLREDLGSRFELQILRRGFNYYLKKNVKSVCGQANVIRAEVTGTELYKVEIDPDFFGVSTCTCPYGGFCKHMAAVIFQVFSMMGQRPELLLREVEQANDAAQWKQKQAEQRREQMKEKARKRLEAEQLAQRKRQNGAPREHDGSDPGYSQPPARDKEFPLQETGRVQDWLQWIDNWFMRQHIVSDYVFQSLYESLMEQLSLQTQSWNSALRGWLMLHFQLSVLNRLDSFMRERGTAYLYGFAYSKSAQIYHSCLDRLAEALESLNLEEAAARFAGHAESLIDRIAQLAAEPSRTPVNWKHVYRLIWATLANVETWRGAEVRRLRAVLHDNSLSSGIKDEAVCGLVHFDILLQQDREAMRKIDLIAHLKTPAIWYPYLNGFRSLKDWNRLLLWLQWLAPEMRSANSADLADYQEYWDELLQQQSVESEWMNVFGMLLPRAYPYYAKRLLEKERFAEWADVAMAAGYSIFHLDPKDLRLVENADPRSLLPLYHQAVEQLILHKGRQNYRQAVKYLKKLRTIYAKLKQKDRWERFIETLVARHSRLRALREEFKKGKLIS